MKKILHISGLHCVSCEILLEKELKKIPQLKQCKISHKKGIAEIECNGDFPYEEVESAINNCGYKIVSNRAKKETIVKNTLEDYYHIIFIFITVATGAFLLKEIEISRFFPDFGSKVNIFIALVLGLVASLSTCLALVGGIVMGFGSTYPVNTDSKHPFISRSIPHIYFHIGRVVGFMILGGLLGLVGSKVNYSLSFTGYLTIVVGVVMFYMGLQILNIVPNITKLGFHLPKFLSKGIHKLENKTHHFTPMLIGLLTFFLPCGFTQTMQLAAVTSQSFFSGALIMGAFALGTLPVLLSVGIGATYAKKTNMGFFTKLIGVIIIFFSIYSFNSGLVLTGSSFKLGFWKTSTETTSSVVSDNVQVIKMNVDWTFKPNEFRVKKGVPVRWEITGVNVSGCSNKVVIPKLNLSKKINKGLNVLEFTPEKEGVLPFSCWMGMIGGQFIVE